MKANELRIGNYIYEYNKPFKVTHFTIGSFARSSSKYNGGRRDLKPIPLTEEWLLKFGFESSQDYYIKPNSGLMIGVTLDGQLYSHFDSDYPLLLNHKIKYVHQLQNLYFAFTNTELLWK